MIFAAFLFSSLAAADSGQNSPQDAEIRVHAPGPGISLPSPSLSQPILNEVLDSLDLGRNNAPPPAEHVRINPAQSRAPQFFPEPPYLALSPANIRAVYDAWTFEVFDGNELILHLEGTGALQDNLEWSGEDTEGRFVAAPGHSYRYRLVARRGARSFNIDSDPVALNSLTRNEFSGDKRLEAAASVLFKDSSADFRKEADLLLEALVARLRASKPGPGGVYRLAFYSADPKSELAKVRAESMSAALGAALGMREGAVRVPVQFARDDYFAAFLPAAEGPRFHVEPK